MLCYYSNSNYYKSTTYLFKVFCCYCNNNYYTKSKSTTYLFKAVYYYHTTGKSTIYFSTACGYSPGEGSTPKPKQWTYSSGYFASHICFDFCCDISFDFGGTDLLGTSNEKGEEERAKKLVCYWFLTWNRRWPCYKSTYIVFCRNIPFQDLLSVTPEQRRPHLTTRMDDCGSPADYTGK